MSTSLPSNVHVSTHPCLQAKLSQLRDSNTNARETKALVHEISLILGVEALASGLSVKQGPTATTKLNYPYKTTTISTPSISLIPILRSGLSMVSALETLLPSPVPTHHLGLFREPTTLQPVEYYNNLPYHKPSIPPTPPPANASANSNTSASELALLLDPIIATGGTAAAAIQTLREWGVQRVIVLAVLGAEEGLRKAAGEWEEGVEIWVAGVDGGVNERGMIVPGVGDVGDRLFLTIGK